MIAGCNLDEPPTQRNLLMTLPGELRNRIYEMSLYGGDAPTTGDQHVMLIGNHTLDAAAWNDPKVSFWKEPALLSVSKQVRQEALAICYDVNKFKIVIEWAMIRPAMEWIKRFYGVCGSVSQLEVKITTSESWRDHISDWYAVADFIFDTPVAHTTSVREEFKHWVRFFGQNTSPTPLFPMHPAPFKMMIEVAAQAKCQKVTREDFQATFRDWAVSMILYMRVGNKPTTQDALNMVHKAMGSAAPSARPRRLIRI